jgi:uncharacterized membrane protein
MDSHARSLAKAVSYRIVGSLSTAGLVFLLTGSATVSLGAGLLDALIKTVLYFAHERVWNYISYGRAKAPEYEI